MYLFILISLLIFVLIYVLIIRDVMPSEGVMVNMGFSLFCGFIITFIVNIAIETIRPPVQNTEILCTETQKLHSFTEGNKSYIVREQLDFKDVYRCMVETKNGAHIEEYNAKDVYLKEDTNARIETYSSVTVFEGGIDERFKNWLFVAKRRDPEHFITHYKIYVPRKDFK